MCFKMTLVAILGGFITPVAWPQVPPANGQTAPIYRVTVVERTVSAIDYQYRTGPTAIDFRGTVLMPKAKGQATVESKAGRSEIDAKFDRVDSPARFGREYLTYVLWAVTPDGRAKNLGEILTSQSDKGHLRVTTDLQSFGLIVTAEPYAAVRLPSDVVVMENQVRPDTIGNRDPINIKYELMPRGAYTYNVGEWHASDGPKVSMDRYESLLELYQAQNAVQIAQAQGAEQYAPEIFSRSEDQLQRAQRLEDQKSDRSQVVTAARQASETAEDARTVALERKHEQELAQARREAAVERQERMEAEAAAQRAQAEAAAEGQTLAAEREVRRQAEAMAAAAASAPVPAPPSAEPAASPSTESANRMDPIQENREQAGLRASLLAQLNGAMGAVDTPRGLVVTIPDGDFRGAWLSPEINASLSRVASIVVAHPGLAVDVEGNTDSAGAEAGNIARQRAEAVRAALIQSGLRPDFVSARGLGNSRLITSNASAAGRERNRRVEIVIAGSAIGSLPNWDKPYSLDLR